MTWLFIKISELDWYFMLPSYIALTIAIAALAYSFIAATKWLYNCKNLFICIGASMVIWAVAYKQSPGQFMHFILHIYVSGAIYNCLTNNSTILKNIMVVTGLASCGFVIYLAKDLNEIFVIICVLFAIIAALISLGFFINKDDVPDSERVSGGFCGSLIGFAMWFVYLENIEQTGALQSLNDNFTLIWQGVGLILALVFLGGSIASAMKMQIKDGEEQEKLFEQIRINQRLNEQYNSENNLHF